MYPILWQTPWFNLYSYGLFIAIGYSVGTFWILREAGREGIDRETIFDMLLLQLVVGVSGSRLLYLAEYQPEHLSLKGFFAFEQGGLTFYGSVLSSIVFDFLFIKFQRLSFWQVMDCVGMGLPLGIFFARIGCFLNGCCHGGVCAWPWGVTFPKVGPNPVHPTQLYESLAGLAIFLILQRYRGRRRTYGHSFLACMGLYGFLRFLIEFWRADNPVFLLGMSLSQVVGLAMVAASALLWYILARHTDLRLPPMSTGKADGAAEGG